MMPVFQTCLNILRMTHAVSQLIQERISFEPVNATVAILQANVMLGQMYGKIVRAPLCPVLCVEIRRVMIWVERHVPRALKIVDHVM